MSRLQTTLTLWAACFVLAVGLAPAQDREAGTLALVEEPPGGTLEVSGSREGEVITLEISGGAREYEMSLEPGGGFLLRFPGCRLVLAPPLDALDRARAAIRSPDTLALQEGRMRLARVEAEDGLLRVRMEPDTSGLTATGDYRIGVGDKLAVAIYGDEELKSRDFRVVGDGTISIPYLGDVSVAGLTVREVAEDLGKQLSAGYIVDPKVSVEILEHQSQWVQVSGEVEKPGRYYLKGKTRLVDIIAEAGGTTPEAGIEIRLTRSGGAEGESVRTINRLDLYLSDNPAFNPLLLSGDTVTVAAQQHFFIRGEVKQPGRYALDRDTTILKAISLAGGFGEFANQKKVELLRKDPAGETLSLLINVERIGNRKDEDVAILPGDIINVKARFL